MTRHKVFISYHHANDQIYKDTFVKNFQSYFIDKSVHVGEYEEDLSTEYIKRLIREEKITDSSIIVVLIGSETYKRKHVDWEISAGLSCMAGGCSGLIGIILPTYYTNNKENKSLKANYYNPDTIPPRLYDNISTKYASIYSWDRLYNTNGYGDSYLYNWLEDAYAQKCYNSAKINNSRLQFVNNRA